MADNPKPHVFLTAEGKATLRKYMSPQFRKGYDRLLADLEAMRIRAENAENASNSAHAAVMDAANRLIKRREEIEAKDAEIERLRKALEKYKTLRPESEYHEDRGPVLWWHFPICEPPHVGYGPGMEECDPDGSPSTCRRQIESGWLTHWSPIPHPTNWEELTEEAESRALNPQPTLTEPSVKPPTVIADLDVEIKKIIVMAHAVNRIASTENLDRLARAIKDYDNKYEGQRATNLIRALDPHPTTEPTK